MEKMENIVTMDKSGRIVIPMKIRSRFDTNRFELRADTGKIELIPIKPLGSLFGTLPEIETGSIKKERF
ncbi:MAG: AbrB/MazE/SpoVT family DNA-binding domain-containing protein [Halobacteriota archaeon]|nr:AbrB/MazE/SpoVT family DNA-binding domain-containing protein [Halobacteriota archaeon]